MTKIVAQRSPYRFVLFLADFNVVEVFGLGSGFRVRVNNNLLGFWFRVRVRVLRVSFD